MSKYSHFEMCEKIFGQKYKWNEQKHDYEPYSRTDMWNKMIEQQDKISDLEAKLAESERKLEEYKKCNCKECMTDYEKNLNQIIDKFLNENIKLKQQLAESEKERHEEWKTGKEWKWEWQKVNQKLEKAEQDKISFAVEQLEKVKENIHYLLSFDYNLLSKVNEQFDNQINVLRNNKDGIH